MRVIRRAQVRRAAWMRLVVCNTFNFQFLEIGSMRGKRSKALEIDPCRSLLGESISALSWVRQTVNCRA